MSNAPHLWVKETRKDVLRAGEVREAAEESANQSYETVKAPDCPACGKPVADAEWDRHRAEVHGRPRQVVRPMGKPDAREALFSAPSKDLLDLKIMEWRTTHPGVKLEPLGEGKNRDTGLLWVRCRIRTNVKGAWV